jgi:hypothetical protein
MERGKEERIRGETKEGREEALGEVPGGIDGWLGGLGGLCLLAAVGGKGLVGTGNGTKSTTTESKANKSNNEAGVNIAFS